MAAAGRRDVEAAQASLDGHRGVQLRACARAAAAEGHRAEPARPLRLLEPEALQRRLLGPVRDVRRRGRGRALGDPGAGLARLRVHPGRRARARHPRRSADPRLGRVARLQRRADADRGRRPDQRHGRRAISGVRLGIHLCRGNNAGMWMASGGYDYIAKALFERATAFDAYFLEYDDARSGTFEPLSGAPRRQADRPRPRVDEDATRRDARGARRPHRGRGALLPPRAARAVDAVRLRVDRRPATRSPRPTRSASCGWSPMWRTPPGARWVPHPVPAPRCACPPSRWHSRSRPSCELGPRGSPGGPSGC